MENIILKDQELKKEKKNELEKGELPDGSSIEPPYVNLGYQRFKQKMNPKAKGNVDLILKGAFSGNMFPKKKKERTFIFKSSDWKSEVLQEKYGEEIMGLNQNTFDEKQKKVYAFDLIREIKRKTNVQ